MQDDDVLGNGNRYRKQRWVEHITKIYLDIQSAARTGGLEAGSQ